MTSKTIEKAALALIIFAYILTFMWALYLGEDTVKIFLLASAFTFAISSAGFSWYMIDRFM